MGRTGVVLTGHVQNSMCTEMSSSVRHCLHTQHRMLMTGFCWVLSHSHGSTEPSLPACVHISTSLTTGAGGPC